MGCPLQVSGMTYNVSSYTLHFLYVYICFLYVFCVFLGIQQYLFENNRIDNIFTDFYYDRFTECLNEILATYQVSLNSQGSCHAQKSSCISFNPLKDRNVDWLHLTIPV